jgi:hypothetical protein
MPLLTTPLFILAALFLSQSTTLFLSLLVSLFPTTMRYRELNSTPTMLEVYITNTIVLDT